MNQAEFDRRNAIVKKRLLAKGSLRKLPENDKEQAQRKVYEFKGEPLSQTIIEERECR